MPLNPATSPANYARRRRHVTPTTIPMMPPTTPLNPATSPANYARRRRHVTLTTSQTTPHHDTAHRVPPPPHRYRMETAGGGDGGEGRMGGENVRGGGKERRQASRRCPPDLLSTPGGMEGRGQRQGTSLSPGVLDDDKGAHMQCCT